VLREMKVVRARLTSDISSSSIHNAKGFSQFAIKSGVSCAAKRSLNVSAAPIVENPNMNPATRPGIFLNVLLTVRLNMSVYANSTRNQSKFTFSDRKSLVMSDAPACFCPVWFHRRAILSIGIMRDMRNASPLLVRWLFAFCKSLSLSREHGYIHSQGQKEEPPRRHPVPEVVLLFNITASKHHNGVGHHHYEKHHVGETGLFQDWDKADQ